MFLLMPYAIVSGWIFSEVIMIECMDFVRQTLINCLARSLESVTITPESTMGGLV